MGIDFLAASRVSNRREEPFEGRTNLDENALRGSASAPATGRPPLRKEMPEALSIDRVLEFIHDRAAAHVA